MTSPATSFATLRPDIASSLEEFDLMADQAGFVGLRIAPVIEVDKPVGQFGKIELAELLKGRTTLRANDGGYERGEGRGTKDTYTTVEHGFEERVDDREAEMYGDFWDAEMLAAMRTRDAVLRNHNQRVIEAATTDRSQNTAAGTVWSTAGSATPIANVTAAKIAIRNRTGLIANAMVCDWEAFEYLRSCNEVIDRIKYAGIQNPTKRSISVEVLAQALDIDELIVSGSVKNSANEAQTASIASMWTRTEAFVFVKSTSMNLKQPRFMNTFHWGADGSQIGSVFESYRDESRRSDIIRHRMDTDEKVLYPEACQRITGVLS